MRKIFLSIIYLSISIIYAYADIDSAKRLYSEGDYAKAFTELETLVKKSPKDAAANYYLGATLYRMGQLQEAVAPLRVAENANWPVAARDLAEINLKVYNLDAASEHIEAWEKILDKQKAEYPEELSLLRDRVLMARNMLDRVEKIEVIQTFEVDSVDFFKCYQLSPATGELLTALYLPDEYAEANPRVVYKPQNGKELFWGMPDADGSVTLVVSDVLDDGTLTPPESIGEEINDGNDADFPFLLDDGYTIYYGAKGDNSLGGYDIFMTRRSSDGSLLQPQNIGMPYNSPYNDYMLVIDNERNIGWFASDRAHIPGKVTIYTFVPSAVRVNHNPDSENIIDYALLRGVDAADDLDERLADDASAVIDDDDNDDFLLPLGNGQIYTNLSQFKNSQARQAMRDLLKRMYDIEVMQTTLDDLRIAYGRGDKSKAKEISALEQSLSEAPIIIERLTNKIISLETKQ